VVGLRLRPGIAGYALGLPASELRDLRVPLEDVWGRGGRALAERLGEEPTAAARRRALEGALLARAPAAVSAPGGWAASPPSSATRTRLT
jgi:hypothetical protein